MHFVSLSYKNNVSRCSLSACSPTLSLSLFLMHAHTHTHSPFFRPSKMPQNSSNNNKPSVLFPLQLHHLFGAKPLKCILHYISEANPIESNLYLIQRCVYASHIQFMHIVEFHMCHSKVPHINFT